MGPEGIVEGPPVTPPLHGLLDTAIKASDAAGVRWQGGFTFSPEMCSNGGIWVPCVTEVPDPEGSGDDELITQVKDLDDTETGDITFHPYQVWDEKACSSFGFLDTDYKGIALRRLEASQHKQVEHEFWTGAKMNFDGSPYLNMSLVNSVSAASILNPGWEAGEGTLQAVSPKVALRLLTQGLANCNSGSRGMMHATPYLAELWAEEGYIQEVGGKLMTRTRGNLVVSGGGYPGTGPNILEDSEIDPIPTGSGEVWVYATGMVQTRLGEIVYLPDENEIHEALSRRTNDILYRAERFAAAVWDDCCTLAVLVDVCSDNCTTEIVD